MREGDVIAGAYRIQKAVRSGGISVVYRAEDLRSHDPVAVKVINTSQADVAFKRRIEREISVLQSLSHPHIVRCLGSGQMPSDRMYLVLEWLEGQDLADAMQVESFSLRRVLTLLVQMADALASAHREGVVHRDIKPANIYLMRCDPERVADGRLIDFGVAKVPETTAAITKAGAILGTPSYMAPEQANYAMDVDGRADIYSLGVVAFELLTGRLPWASSTDLARLARILVEEALPLKVVIEDVPHPVADLIDDMLVGDVERRIVSAEAVRDLAQSHLEFLTQEELARVYAQGSIGQMVREETMDVPPAPHRRHSTPTRAISLGASDPMVVPAAVRYRSVVSVPSTDEVRSPKASRSSSDHEVARSGEYSAALDADVMPSLMEAEAMETMELRSPAITEGPEFVEQTAIASHARGPLIDGNDGATQDDVIQPRAMSESDQLMATLAMPQPNEADEDGLESETLAPQVGYPFYGRVAAIERIERRVLKTLSSRRPSLTLMIGPAGIGKTRLRKEIRRMIPLKTSARVLEVRTEELQRATPFSGLQKMLFTAAGVVSDEPSEQIRAKLLRLIPSAEILRDVLGQMHAVHMRQPDAVIGPQGAGRTQMANLQEWNISADELLDDPDEERAMLATFLCEALGIRCPMIPALQAARQDPHLLKQQTHRALEVLLRGLGVKSGLVILVDDAHFLDRSSGLVLRRLLESSQVASISVLIFALPTLLDTETRDRSPLTEETGLPLETVELGPLEARASREMVRSLVHANVASDALEKLVQRAGGNPLFLEQLVRTVLTTGTLRRGEHGEFELQRSKQGDPERVPPTVAAAVSARISSLRPSWQRVLAAAAVFGEVFWAEGVARLLEQPMGDVRDLLKRLDQEAFIRVRASSRYRRQTEMEFHHAVIRSVALSRLKKKRRSDFERKAAEYLESVGERDLGVLASHLASSTDASRAAQLYADAGKRSLGLGDPVATTTLAEECLRAADIVDNNVLRLRAYDLIEQVSLLNKDWDSGRDVLDARADIVEKPTDKADIFERRSRLAFVSKRFEESRIEALEAKAFWQKLDVSVGLARADLLFAEASEALADGRAALRGYLSAMRGFDASEAWDWSLRSAHGLARVAVASGDYQSAEDRFRNALIQARTRRDYEGIYEAQIGLAELSRVTGQVARARQFLDEASATALDRERRLLVYVEQAALSGEELRFTEGLTQLDAVWRIATVSPELGLIRRRTALRMGQMLRRPVGREHELKDHQRTLHEVHEHLLVTIEEAVTEEPSLLLALRLNRAWVLTLLGDHDEARRLTEEIEGQFSRGMMVFQDEPVMVFYTLVRVLRQAGGGRSDIQRLMRRTVTQLDQTSGRMLRGHRRRYLERWMARSLLTEAAELGIAVTRDPESHRLTVADT